MDPYQNSNPRGNQEHMQFGSAGDGGSGGSDIPQGTVDNKQKKKLLHRDIERQRRQEMATLFASLRDHLPLQYIKVHISNALFLKISYFPSTNCSNKKPRFGGIWLLGLRICLLKNLTP